MNQRRVVLSLVAFLSLGLFLMGIRRFLGHSMYFIDDPFISMRYAANLVRHGELVFNEGERVEGYSNFLHVLVHALMFKMTGQLAAAPGIDRVALIDVFASMCEAALLFALAWRAREQGARAAWFAAAVLTLGSWPFAFWAVAGLETPLEALLYVAIAFSLNALDNNLRSRAAGIALGLLLCCVVLLRFEGAVVALPCALLIALWLDRQGQRGRAIALLGSVVAVVALYHVWRMVYFGTLLPNTYVAKATGGSTVQRVSSGASYFALWFLAQIGASGALIYAAFSLRSAPPVQRLYQSLMQKPVELLALCIVAIKAFLVVWGGGDWMPGYRMLLPIAPLTFFLTARALVAALPEPLFDRDRLGVAPAALLALSVVLVARVTGAQFTGFDANSDEGGNLRKLPRGYVEVGELLEKHYGGSREEVAVGEAGLIPYSAPNVRFMDLFGLVDRDMAHQPGGMHQRVHIDHFLERAPAAVVFAHLHRAPPYGQYQYGPELLGNLKFHAAYVRADIGQRLDTLGWALYVRRNSDVGDLQQRTDDPLVPTHR